MQFDKIVELVKEYEEKDHEAKTIESTINSCQSALKRFADTGNMHIDVTFDHGNWESIYPKGIYPSDVVKDAVISDVKMHIAKLSIRQNELLERLIEIKKALEEPEAC